MAGSDFTGGGDTWGDYPISVVAGADQALAWYGGRAAHAAYDRMEYVRDQSHCGIASIWLGAVSAGFTNEAARQG